MAFTSDLERPELPLTLLTGRTIVRDNGQSTNLIDIGAGVPLIFVHGLPGQASDFSPLLAELARDYRCIAYDRAGYGKSSPNADRSQTRIEASVSELIGLMDHLEIERAVLVGWSYGGHIAIDTAASHPDRVSSLVLFGSAGPTFEWPGSFTDRLLFRSGFGEPLMRLVRRFGASAIRSGLNDAYGGGMPDSLVASFQKSLHARDMIETWIREGAHWQPSTAIASNLSQPTLILHGDLDTRVPFQVAEDLASAIGSAQLIKLHGAGHWPFVSHSDLVANHFRRFLVGG